MGEERGRYGGRKEQEGEREKGISEMQGKMRRKGWREGEKRKMGRSAGRKECGRKRRR